MYDFFLSETWMMSALTNFQQHLFEDAEGQQWMFFDNFITEILRKNKLPSEKGISQTIIRKFFKGHNGIYT